MNSHKNKLRVKQNVGLCGSLAEPFPSSEGSWVRMLRVKCRYWPCRKLKNGVLNRATGKIKSHKQTFWWKFFSLVLKMDSVGEGLRKILLLTYSSIRVAHPPNPPLNFTPLQIALSSAALNSPLKMELFKLPYPESTPSPPHVRLHNRLQPQLQAVSLAWPFRSLTWHQNETKREVWLLGTWFGIAPANKLVSLRGFFGYEKFSKNYIKLGTANDA